MALTLGMFASCTGTSIGKEPVIDEEKGTINGKAYDNETYACWQLTWEYTETCTDGEEGDADHGTTNMWCTEFTAQCYKADFEYSHNWSAYYMGHGCKCTGSCTVKETDHTQNECY